MEYQGIAAASGYVLGPAYVLEDQQLQITRQTIPSDSIEIEVQRLEDSVSRAIREIAGIKEAARQRLGEDEAEIFTAQILVLEDPEYLGAIKEKIRSEKMNAEAAVQEITEQFLTLFADLDHEYIRERAADLRDVSHRLLRGLMGIQSLSLSAMTERVIVVAHDLTPSDTARLDRSKVAGFVADIGGRTSHSAIMARTLGLPAVVGLQTIAAQVKNGDFLIVDGNAGKVFVNPSENMIQTYRNKQNELTGINEELNQLIDKPTLTRDGVQVELAANIGNPEDAKRALATGAEGIGLYRTEFLYMGRKDLPTEQEQFSAYQRVALMFGQKRPVVIRSLDIGGDKELPYLNIPKEMNPFLGYRAIRFCLDRTDIFKTQLRAILRASAYGNIKLMFPMIATLQELRAAYEVLEAVKQDLSKENIPFNAAMEVGIMVEIPAVAVLAEQFAQEVDFFSIGTNDLVQYTLAADRLNEKVSYLYQPYNPAVLRLIQGVISAAHQKGKWVGMCGEMAGDLTAIPILLGLGLDEFSMSAGSLLPARALLSQLTRSEARRMAETVLALNSAEEIKGFVEKEIPFITKIRNN
ncbi:phosphoenolpyruvate--protein phosphotransferase [Desulfosporosinus sp. PR]|uniref:phosphoenolpyruvate--protein phosphotransferase n=1 Tax=Candidatus Desulfosporosinus nitrosoreducens TaxID=3401928 RepID=UPI0027EC24B0|nr:phosphoenolpyruvate--protein phosphotransferase [Desulfosporosinus sp. PR]MDQ7096609.1 phosphoenolpyruvate--protein phosphotransferase [Desulfosporosinus sp. PR]